MRDTADAVDAREMTVHQCGLLRFVWACLAICLSVSTFPDTLLGDLIGSNMFVIPSDQERPGNIGSFISCAMKAEVLETGPGLGNGP